MRRFTFKKMTALLLAVISVCSLLVVNVSAASLTQAQFNKKIESAKELYKEGTIKHTWPKGSDCHGFGRWISEYVWGVDFNNGQGNGWSITFAGKSNYNFNSLKPGDVVRYRSLDKNGQPKKSNHTIFILSISGDKIKFADCNRVATSKITWNGEFTKSYLSSLMSRELYLSEDECSTAYGKDKKNGYIAHYSGNNLGIPANQKYWLDLNSIVNGNYVNNISTVATADVYINGKLVANDCKDFCKEYPAGTSYKITDIRTKKGYVLTGSTTYEGTLWDHVNVNIPFQKEGTYTAYNFKMKSGAYTNAYDSINGKKVGRVYPNDVVTVKKVYTNGWMQISCPWDTGGSKIVYVKTTEFKFKATKYINAYSKVSGTKVGRVYPKDLVSVLEITSSGWMKCSCPWEGNTKKIIYIKTAEIY